MTGLGPVHLIVQFMLAFLMDSNQRIEIIAAYGDVLENRTFSVGRESDLPFPKQLIREALSEELLNPTYPEMLNALEVGFVELESFLPEEQYLLVTQFEKAVTDAHKTVDAGEVQSLKKAASSIAKSGELVREIQQEISQRYEERLRQVQNMRQLRKQP